MKFERLEALRGFAAFYVCLGHVLPGRSNLGGFEQVFRFGQEAVIVFFLLSGFVIQWASSKDLEAERFGRYFSKRFIRIYTVWCLAVAALFLISSVETGTIAVPSVMQLLGNALMLQDLSEGKPAVICDPVYGNAPLWSLHYEWWFYMLFPLVARFATVQARMHLVGVFGIVGAVTYVLFPNPISRLLMYFGIWWIGAHAASCLRANKALTLRDLYQPLGYVFLSAMPMALLCMIWLQRGEKMTLGFHPILELRHLLSAIALVLAAFAWRKLSWFGFSWSVGLFSIVSPISFSLYVIHFRSLAHASYLRQLGNPPLEMFLYVLITIAFCYLVEIVLYPWLRAKLLPAAVTPDNDRESLLAIAPNR